MEQIDRLLSANTVLFPAAHVRWIRIQVKAKPPMQRLKEILTHLTNALSAEGRTLAQPTPLASNTTEAKPVVGSTEQGGQNAGNP